jgi:hypothetical protein
LPLCLNAGTPGLTSHGQGHQREFPLVFFRRAWGEHTVVGDPECGVWRLDAGEFTDARLPYVVRFDLAPGRGGEVVRHVLVMNVHLASDSKVARNQLGVMLARIPDYVQQQYVPCHCKVGFHCLICRYDGDDGDSVRVRVCFWCTHVCRAHRYMPAGAAHTWLWCIAGDFNLKGVPVELPDGPGGSVATTAMFSRMLSNFTNSLPYLVGAVLERLYGSSVNCSASDGEQHHGLALSKDHAKYVLDFVKNDNDPQSYDHVIVSAGTLRGSVLNVFMRRSFNDCFVAFGAKPLLDSPTTWSGFVKSFVSDHMPVLAVWTFA